MPDDRGLEEVGSRLIGGVSDASEEPDDLRTRTDYSERQPHSSTFISERVLVDILRLYLHAELRQLRPKVISAYSGREIVL